MLFPSVFSQKTSNKDDIFGADSVVNSVKTIVRSSNSDIFQLAALNDFMAYYVRIQRDMNNTKKNELASSGRELKNWLKSTLLSKKNLLH